MEEHLVGGKERYALRDVSTYWSEFETVTEGSYRTDPPLDMNAIDCKLAGPHSNAFIDLDGDCLAGMVDLNLLALKFNEESTLDLFLTCVDPSDSSRATYQIWLNKKEQGFVFSQSGKLPKGSGQISFADIGVSISGFRQIRCLK